MRKLLALFPPFLMLLLLAAIAIAGKSKLSDLANWKMEVIS